MSRTLSKFIWLLISLAAQQMSAFTVWGPADSWETPDLDYVSRYYYSDVELGAPKNFGAGYRLNCPTIVYAYDFTFLDYFGQQGVKAVDSAMALLNKLPAASSASPDLSEFLTDGIERVNQSASAMSLYDLKSSVLNVMLEHMGLQGQTHVFDLRARVPQPGPACGFDYFTIIHNFDPITYDPTPYVNGVLYTYQIWDGCPIGVSVGDAIEQAGDSVKPIYNTVSTTENLELGGFYLGITRDDFGGLRYLYRHNNYNSEFLPPNSTLSFAASSPWTPVGTTNSATNGVVSTNGMIFGGVEKFNFVKVPYNSSLGTTFTPVVIKYKIPVLTNNHVSAGIVTRTITQPDIIFSAADLVVVAPPFINDPVLSRTVPVFLTVPAPDGTIPSGPGTITPPMKVVFNNVGAIYYNFSPGFLDQATSVSPLFIWGSFDGTTNAPIVFPSGSSIVELEQQVLNGGATPPGDVWEPAGFQTGFDTNATTIGP